MRETGGVLWEEAPLRRAVRTSGGSAQACRHLGEFLETRGRGEEALRWLRVAAAKGGDPAVDFKIGWLSGRRGDFESMRRHFERFLACRSGRGEEPLARFRAAMGLQAYGPAFALLEDGLKACGAAALESLHRPWPDSWLHPDTLSPAGRDYYRRQREALRRWSARNPESPWPDFFQGCIHWRLYDFEAALGAMTALERLPERRFGWLRYFTGVLRLRLKRYPSARADFEATLRCRPEFWHARCSLGETLLCLRDGDSAFREFARAADGEGRAEVWAWHGEALLWIGRYREALTLLDRAVAAGAWLGCGWRGAAHLVLGDFAAAQPDLDRAVVAAPFDAEAHLWRGELLRRMGRYQEALRDLDGSLALDPAGVWARFDRALALAALDRRREMRAEFRRLPEAAVRPVLRALGRAMPRSDREIEAALRAGLAMAGGLRRSEDYLQGLWQP